MVENKFSLCVLPTQQGKTFSTIKTIKDKIEANRNMTTRNLHIVFTMNTLLNNEQFTLRLDEINRIYIENENTTSKKVCIFTSKSSNLENYNHVKYYDSLKGQFLVKDKSPYVIVACTNAKRVNDITKLTEDLQKIKDENRHFIDSVYIYYDEVHEYISMLAKQIRKFSELNIVKQMIGLTATPAKIFTIKDTEWQRIQMMIYPTEYNEVNYHSIKDMEFKINDDFFFDTSHNQKASNVIGYIQDIFDKYNKDIFGNKENFIFVPGYTTQKSHDDISNMIFEYNEDAIVVIINGKKKTLTYFKDNGDKTTIDIANNSSEEICVKIKNIRSQIETQENKKRITFITGFLCVQMGQTLIEEQYGPFSHAIIGHDNLEPSVLYQLAGRLSGRTKHWNSFKQTKIFTTENNKKIVIDMENAAKKLAKEYQGEDICINDYTSDMTPSVQREVHDELPNHHRSTKPERTNNNEDKCWKVFSGLSALHDAKTFTKDKFGINIRRKNDAEAPKELQDSNGNSPSKQTVIDRFWGLSEKTKVRLVPLSTKEWILYWKKSTFPNLEHQNQ